MSSEAYMRGFVNRCLERGVDPDLLCKHAEAVAGRLEKKAGVGSILRGVMKRLVPFKGSMMRHPVRWGAGALLGGGAAAYSALGPSAAPDTGPDGRSMLAGAAIGGGTVLGGILIGNLVADRIRERRKKKALAKATDDASQEAAQLPGIG